MLFRVLVACAVFSIGCSKSDEAKGSDDERAGGEPAAKATPTTAAEPAKPAEPAEPAEPALSPDDVPFLNARAFEGVLVGGQMTAEDLEKAKEAGVTTIVNLRMPEEPGVTEEIALVGELGMRYVAIPISGPEDLTDEAAKKLDDALGSAEGRAIVHCASGNRVGALFAVRARKLQGKSAEEALAIGKRAGMTGLEGAVRELLGAPQ